MSDSDPNGDAASAGLQRGGVVEEIVFGTRSLGEIDTLVDRFLRRELGAGIVEVLFRATSVGVVLGVQLTDQRQVVVKAHQPSESRERLQAVREIQRDLFDAGLPCPQPLSGPVAVGNGHLTVETLLDDGEYRDTHDPTCRRLIAQALAWHLAVTSVPSPAQALTGGWSLIDSDGLWPAQAHAPIFDFAATSVGAEWIDALGTPGESATL